MTEYQYPPLPKKDFTQEEMSIFFEYLTTLRFVHKIYEDAISKIAKRYGMSFPQFLVLLIVNCNEGLKVSEIARIGSWSVSTVTSLLTGLVKKEMLKLEPVTNGKGKSVYLTDLGREITNRPHNIFSTKLARFIEVIGYERMKRNVDFSYKIIEQVDGGDFEQIVKHHLSKNNSIQFL